MAGAGRNRTRAASDRPPAALDVNLLGPLQVISHERPVTPTAGRLRTLLAVLAMAAGRVVPVDRLASAVWGDDQPGDPRSSLQTYVTRLRASLGAGAVSTRPEGYLLHTAPERVDALRFLQLLDAVTAASDPGARRAALAGALALWRGDPFEDVPCVWLARTEAPRLVERRLAAVEQLADLDLAAGCADGLVAELRQLTARYPLREPLWARLLSALDRAGRAAEALAAYEIIRRSLAEELGTDPGPELRQIHAGLLARSAPVRSGGPPPPRYPAPIVPRQLPAEAGGFTGRAAELTTLERIGAAPAGSVVVISGMAGIGKTALAVHAAQRVAARYPDGQLFLDLHGHTPGMAPVDPAEALDRMLRSLGVAGNQIPVQPEERAGFYRSRLADRRLLILLDNAATGEQVRPLLPGTPGCLVLITSRRRLTDLDPTHLLLLDPLPLADAVGVFAGTVGAGRLAGVEPALLAETVQLCGGLPLAIRIAAARFRSHRAWHVEHLADRLRDHRHRLAELETGQRSVIAALDLSYQQLSESEQRGYRRIGLHPGPDLDRYAAAALAGTSPGSARRLLDRLLEVQLVQEPVPDRYAFHDLVRAHAAHIAAATDPEADRRTAVSRLLGHYRQTASAALGRLYPYESRPGSPAAGPPVPPLADPAQATAWLETELPNLMAAAELAAGRGSAEAARELAALLHPHLRTRGSYAEAEALHQHALAAARAERDRPGELAALTGLGQAHHLQGRYDLAAGVLAGALEIARGLGDRSGLVEALIQLGRAHRAQGRYREARDSYDEALELSRGAGNPLTELDVLSGLASLDLLRGRHEEAAQRYQRCLRLAQALGNRRDEGALFADLGRVRRLQGRLDQAADHFGQAVEIAREVGHFPGQLNAVVGLGHVYRRQGRYAPAAECYRQVLDLAQDRHLNWQFEAWQGLGRLHHATGDLDQALTAHHRALELATSLGQLDDQARAHDGLGHAYRALRQDGPARRHWQRALDLLTTLGTEHTEDEEATAAAIRELLGEFDRAPAEDMKAI